MVLILTLFMFFCFLLRKFSRFSVVKNGIVHLEDCLGNFHHSGFEGEGDAWASRGQLDLHQTPDAIAELKGLVDHVLSLKGSLGHSEGIVLAHLGRDAITSALNILNSVLDLIGCRDVLPGAQECFLLHGSILGEEDVERGNAGKVEDVNAVLDGNLNVCEMIHLLDRASAVHGQADVQGLASIQQGNAHWLGGNQTKAVLVQLDTKSLHCLHGLVVEGHLHVDDVVPE